MNSKRYNIIKKQLGELRFTTGLKQFEDYTLEEADKVVRSIEALFNRFSWVTDERCDIILRNGLLGEYGDFVRINDRTINIWIGQYFKHNQNKISTEIQYERSKELENVSEEEKGYWLEVGRNNFREKLKKAKSSGYVNHLSEWGVYWYDKFIKKGILIESQFPLDNIKEESKKDLRTVGRYIDEVNVKAKVTEKIWKLFILKKIKENFDFEPYLK